MPLIVESLPGHPLSDEVVLHVRKHLRRRIRSGRGTAETLALLFGVPAERGASLGMDQALRATDPEQAAAARIAQAHAPSLTTVTLGHDDDHLLGCVRWLRDRAKTEQAFDGIVASDPATLLVLSRAIDLATARAPADEKHVALPLVVEGATGTGKELLARAIHCIWKRETGAKGDFHPLHVAGLPPGQISDELFGHARGAFTDAKTGRKGRIEEADGGTLFIDEVGDLPAEAQVRLLRFLQDGLFSRLGENELRHAGVRVLAATWRRLDDEVAAGRFRMDLLHRLRGDLLELPKLRERHGWTERVVPDLLRRLKHSGDPAISPSAIDALSRAPWDGNLRELDAVLRGAASSAAGATIRVEDLPSRIQRPYHVLALHDKAVGFLADHFDGKPLVKEVVDWRLNEVRRSIDALAAPPPPDGLAAVRDFHAGIPDPSPEHQSARQAIDVYVAAAVEHGRLASALAQWERIAAQPAPELIREVLSEQVSHAKANVHAAAAAAQVAEARVTMSHWYKLWQELAEWPLFRGQHAISVGQGLMWTVSMLHAIEPEWTKKLAAIVRKGGWQGVREKLKELLEESDHKQLVEGPPPDYRTLSPNEWRTLLDEFPTKVALAEYLDIDPKTLASALSKQGLGSAQRRRKTRR